MILQILNYLGVYAPILLIIGSVFLLYPKQTYFIVFLGGLVLNNIINLLLKMAIQEPRPGNDSKAIEMGVVHGVRFGPDKYGMPSGHAQNCTFCLFYLMNTFPSNPWISMTTIIITFISIFQRFVQHNHTIMQLFVGALLGAAIGFQMHSYANQLLQGDLSMRRDDDAPL
jgi:membrane-associated phospholipid phosphatase